MKKKSINLEKIKPTFAMLGLCIALAFSLMAMEFKTNTTGLDPIKHQEIGESWGTDILPPLPKPKPEREQVQKEKKVVNSGKKFSGIDPFKGKKEKIDADKLLADMKINDDSSEDSIVPPVIVKTKIKKPKKDFVLIPEIHPRFKGCENVPNDQVPQCNNVQIQKYLVKNTIYPERAKENNISGKVFVYFETSPTGEIINVKLQKGVHKWLDRQAVEVIQKMPGFTPAKWNGRAVRVPFNIPINFQLK